MKSHLIPGYLAARAALLVVLAIFGLGTSAYGQALLAFSGGSGSPLTVTLSWPVTFTVTTAAAATGLDLQGVGDIFAGGNYRVTGSITYQVSNGPAATLVSVFSGVVGGDLAANDVGAYTTTGAASPAVAVGDTVTISAGSLTTVKSVAAAAPAAGSFSAFIFDSDSGSRISTDGLATVPEPATWATLFLGSAVLFGVRHRRRICRS